MSSACSSSAADRHSPRGRACPSRVRRTPDRPRRPCTPTTPARSAGSRPASIPLRARRLRSAGTPRSRCRQAVRPTTPASPNRKPKGRRILRCFVSDTACRHARRRAAVPSAPSSVRPAVPTAAACSESLRARRTGRCRRRRPVGRVRSPDDGLGGCCAAPHRRSRPTPDEPPRPRSRGCGSGGPARRHGRPPRPASRPPSCVVRGCAARSSREQEAHRSRSPRPRRRRTSPSGRSEAVSPHRRRGGTHRRKPLPASRNSAGRRTTRG
jgi:hypothetical protein